MDTGIFVTFITSSPAYPHGLQKSDKGDEMTKSLLVRVLE